MKIFDRIILLDIDRTIFDSDKFVLEFDKFLTAKNPNIKLKQASDKVKNNFDFVTFLSQFELKIDDLAAEFLAFNQQDYYLGNAKQVIGKLKGEKVVCLSYGDRKIQALKLKLLNLDLPLIATDNQDKGQLIASWEQNGVYLVKFAGETVAARQLILIDDKQSNLDNLPDDCLGLHFNQNSTYKNQITDLAQIFDYL